MDKYSKFKLMRRKKKLFPWLRIFSSKYGEKFFDTGDSEIFVCLLQNVDNEMKSIYLDLNKGKAVDFFNILKTFFLHFWWKIRWKANKNLKTYCKKEWSTEVPTNYSHLKCCVHFLHYMILLSIFLTGGDEASHWIDHILTVMRSLPDAIDILCSALLLINHLKKKHKPVYNIILKRTLYCETVVNTDEPQTYSKVILLFRRLIKHTKDKEEKSQIILFASKLKVSSGVQHWLSSQNIEESKALNYDNLTEDLLSRSYPDEFLRKLSEILIEPKFCERSSLDVNSEISSLNAILNGSSNVSAPKEYLETSNKAIIQNNVSDINASTYCLTEGISDGLLRDKDLPIAISDQLDEVCEEADDHSSNSLKKVSKKRKSKTEDNECCSPQKKQKLHNKKEKSKKALGEIELKKLHQEIEISSQNDTEQSEICSQLSANIGVVDKSERAVVEKVENSREQDKYDFEQKKKRSKSKSKERENNNLKKSKKHSKEKQKAKTYSKGGIKDSETSSQLIAAMQNIEESNWTKTAVDEKVKTSKRQESNNLKAEKKRSKSKTVKEEKQTHFKKSKKHSKEKAIAMCPELETYSRVGIEEPQSKPQLNSAMSNIEEFDFSEAEIHKIIEDYQKQEIHDLKSVKKKSKSKKGKKEYDHLKKSKHHSKEKAYNSEIGGEQIKSKNKERKKTHLKKSKKHTKEREFIHIEKASSINNLDTIIKVENFSENEGRLCPVEVQSKKKKLKKKSKEKLIKSQEECPLLHTKDKCEKTNNVSDSEKSKKRKGKDAVRNTVLNASDSEKEKVDTFKGNAPNHGFNEKKVRKKKKKGALKKVSNEKDSLHFISDDKSSLEDSNKVNKTSKVRMKKVFNNDLHSSKEFQKEIQSRKNVSVDSIALSKQKMNCEDVNMNCANPYNDKHSINSNVDLNISSLEENGETTAFSDTTISDILKLSKIQIYKHNAALGIEAKQTLKRKTNSKDLESEANKLNELSYKDNLVDSEQRSELSSIKNDLLLASKKILEQSYVSESYRSPSLFISETFAKESENNVNKTFSNKKSRIKKCLIASSNFVDKTQKSDSYNLTTILQQSHSANINEDTFLSKDSFNDPITNKEVSVSKSSEYSYNSLSNSSLVPYVVLEDISKSSQITASENTFNSESNISTSTLASTVTNLEMNVSQELTLENIVRANELYGEDKSGLIDYLFVDKKDDLQFTQNVSMLHNVTDLNNFNKSSEVSPSQLQTPNTNILLNEIQSESTSNSLQQFSSILESLTNKSEKQSSNIREKSPRFKDVGTTTDTINANDVSVNCNLNDNLCKSSNKLASIEVIINLNTNDHFSKKKHQLVANFDFQSIINPRRTPVISSVSLNTVNSSSEKNDSCHNLNHNLIPNHHPLSITPFHQTTNFNYEKSINSSHCSNSNIICKSDDIGQSVNINNGNSMQTLFIKSSPTTLNNSCSTIELPLNSTPLHYSKDNFNNSLSQNVSIEQLTAENLESFNKELSEQFVSAELPENIDTKHLTTEHPESQDRESNQELIVKEQPENMCRDISFKKSSYRTSTTYPDDSSLSSFSSTSDCHAESSQKLIKEERPENVNIKRLTVENLESLNRESNVVANFPQLMTSENLKSLEKESDEQSEALDMSVKTSSYRASTIYSDADDDDSSLSSFSASSDCHAEFSIGENLEIGSSLETSDCKKNKFDVDSEPESFVKSQSAELNRIVDDSCTKDSPKSKQLTKIGSAKRKSSSPKRRTPPKVSTPVNHSYNLRNRKSIQTPTKYFDEYIV